MTLWLRSGGGVVVDANGNPIDCADCPCPPSGPPVCSRRQLVPKIQLGGTSISVSWTNPTTKNSLLVAVIGISGGPTSTPADSTWKSAVDKTNGASGDVVIYYITRSAVRSGAETFNFTGSATVAWVVLLEYDAQDGGGLDVTISSSGTGTTLDTGTTAATTATTEICVAGFWFDAGNADFSSPTNGFNIVDQESLLGSFYGCVAEKYTTTTGTQRCQVTGSPSQLWAGALATFACGYILPSEYNPAVPCCANPLPSKLRMTLTNPGGGCVCLDGKSLILTFDSFQSGWISNNQGSTLACNGDLVGMVLECINGSWFVESICDGVRWGLGQAQSSVCDPFDVIGGFQVGGPTLIPAFCGPCDATAIIHYEVTV